MMVFRKLSRNSGLIWGMSRSFLTRTLIESILTFFVCHRTAETKRQIQSESESGLCHFPLLFLRSFIFVVGIFLFLFFSFWKLKGCKDEDELLDPSRPFHISILCDQKLFSSSLEVWKNKRNVSISSYLSWSWDPKNSCEPNERERESGDSRDHPKTENKINRKIFCFFHSFNSFVPLFCCCFSSPLLSSPLLSLLLNRNSAPTRASSSRNP